MRRWAGKKYRIARNNSGEGNEWTSGEFLAERDETEWRQQRKICFDGNTIWSSKTFSPEKRIDIISDGEFSKSNQIFEAAIVELKQQGFGRVDHHSPISKENLEKIQSSYNPSSPDLKSLQQVVWFNIMFHLIHRGRENLRLLTKLVRRAGWCSWEKVCLPSCWWSGQKPQGKQSTRWLCRGRMYVWKTWESLLSS